MKKLLGTLYLILGLILTTSLNAFAQQGTISLGGGLMYGSGVGEGSSSFDNDAGLMIDGYYTITDNIRVGAGFGYFFPKSEGGGDLTVTEFNINGHYLLLNELQYNVYGLAGLNIASFKAEAQGFSASSSETGLNIGIGGEYVIGFGNLFGELKYAGLGGDADELVLGAGVRVIVN